MSFSNHQLREQRRTEHGIHPDLLFSARATDMQRTPLGMLRLLLNQLLSQYSSIRLLVRELYKEKCAAFRTKRAQPGVATGRARPPSVIIYVPSEEERNLVTHLEVSVSWCAWSSYAVPDLSEMSGPFNGCLKCFRAVLMVRRLLRNPTAWCFCCSIRMQSNGCWVQMLQGQVVANDWNFSSQPLP